MGTRPRSVGEIEGFVNLIRVACDDPGIYATLEKLLALPDQQRQGVLYSLIGDMQQKGAPVEFVEAIACLVDDAVAEKAYETIFRCQRKRGLFDFLKFSRR